MRSAVLVLVAAASALAQQAKPATGREPELKKAIAAGLVELATWCAEKKLAAEGRPLVDEALGLEPENAKAKALRPKLSGDSAAGDADKAEYDKKLETYGKKLAAFYRELLAQKHQASAQPQYDKYLIRAFELDVKSSGPLLDAEWRDAAGKKDWARAHALLSGAERVRSDPARAKALKEAELKCAESKAVLKQASGHKMQYYLALPKGWSPAKKWPILAAVEGAGCNWMGMMNGYLGNRGDVPLILVVPITFSNTNSLGKDKYPYDQSVLDDADKNGRMAFDEPGLLAVLDDVRRDYAGQEKFFVTGFSGGGNLAFRMIFGYPDKLLAAAPACPNFYGAGKVSDAPERENLPIRVFQGDKDEYLNNPPNLEAQWQAAKAIFDQRGYKNVSRQLLPGIGHSGCCKEVLEFIAPYAKAVDNK